MRKYNWKKIWVNAFWVLAGTGMMVLLGAAMLKKNQKTCHNTNIEITGKGEHLFIDEKDVGELLNRSGRIKGIPIAEMNLRAMETLVEKNPWVKNAEMFIDNNQVLQVRIEERQPVARVFTLEGSSFYLDSTALRLPLSEKLSARVPVFTGFPSDRDHLAKPDSALLQEIVSLGKYILADSFWMAQIGQVAITNVSEFEMIPVIGDQLIELGSTENLDNKFRKLYTFYRKAWLSNGINTYKKLDLRYDNQVVAVKSGSEGPVQDMYADKSNESLKKLMTELVRETTSHMGVENNPQAEKAVSLKLADAPNAKQTIAEKDKLNQPGLVIQKNNNNSKKTLQNRDTSRSKFRRQLKVKLPVKSDTPKAVMRSKGNEG